MLILKVHERGVARAPAASHGMLMACSVRMSGMISLEDVRLFAAVAHHLSFVEAARRGGVPTA